MKIIEKKTVICKTCKGKGNYEITDMPPVFQVIIVLGAFGFLTLGLIHGHIITPYIDKFFIALWNYINKIYVYGII